MEIAEYHNIFKHEKSFWWYKVLHRLVESSVKNWADGRQITILDAGCGTGRMMEILSKYGNTEGIDFSELAVKYAREKNENVIQGDLNQWKSEKKFDVIISLDVLYHSSIKDDAKIISEFSNALKPGGILILNLAAFEFLRRPHDAVVHTGRRYTEKSINNLLKKSGLQVIKSSYRHPHLFILIIFFNIFSRKSKNVKSDVSEIPAFLNHLLYKIGLIENFWILRLTSLPFGSSVFTIAKKVNN